MRVKVKVCLTCPECDSEMVYIEQIQDRNSQYDFERLCCICYDDQVSLFYVNFTAESKVCHACCIDCFKMHCQSSITPAGLVNSEDGVMVPCPLSPTCDKINTSKWNCHVLHLGMDQNLFC